MPAIAERDFSCPNGPLSLHGDKLAPGTTIQVVITNEDKRHISGGSCYFAQDGDGAPTLVVYHRYTLIALEYYTLLAQEEGLAVALVQHRPSRERAWLHEPKGMAGEQDRVAR